MPKKIAEKGIVVASSNNGAVQNIVNELPLLTGIDKEFSRALIEVDYFKIIANSNVSSKWVEDENGDEIASVYSLWTLIDLEKRRITKPDKAGIIMPEIKSYDYTIEEYHEIIKELPLDYVMERQVLYSDVDVNQHMNNSRYIEWAFDAVGIRIFEQHYFKEVSILYKQEMAPGTIAKIYRYFDDKYVKVVFKSIDDSVIYFEMGGYLDNF